MNALDCDAATPAAMVCDALSPTAMACDALTPAAMVCDDSPPWLIFDAHAANSLLGSPIWSGHLNANCWTKDSSRVGGYQNGYDVASAIGRKQGVWTNTYDNRDPHRDITAAVTDDVDWFGGWLLHSRVIVNKAGDGTIVIVDLDGGNVTAFVGVATSPFSSDAGIFAVRAVPIISDDIVEARLYVNSQGTSEKARIMRQDGTIELTYTAAVGHGTTGTIYNLEGPLNLPNLTRYSGLIAIQSVAHSSLGGGDQVDLFNAAGTKLASLYGTGGRAATSFTESVESTSMVQFSPDGRYVAWVCQSSSSGKYELWLMDLSDGLYTPVNLTGGVNWETFCWGPSSDKLIAVNQDDKNLWTVSVPSGTKTQLTTNGVADGSARWRQPQWRGSALIARYDDATLVDPLAQICDVDAATGAYTVLAHQGYGGQADIFTLSRFYLSPNGLYVAYTKPAGTAPYGDDYVDAGFNYIFDVWCIETLGRAGSA